MSEQRVVWRMAQKAPRSEDACLDLSQIDAHKLVAAHQAWQSLYDCAAFDPTGAHLRLYARDMTVWSGFPGAGKSTLIGQSVCKWLQGNHPVFIASMEEGRDEILMRLAATAWGTQYPTGEHLEAFLSAYGPLLFISEAKTPAQLGPLLNKIRELRMGEGVTHAVIDSLMCLSISNESLDGQRRAALALKELALSSGVHIHLVAHPRKLISVDQEPDLNDVAGAREISGIADNVLFVRRGKAAFIGAEMTPLTVLIRKQRHFDGRIGDVAGWFHIKHKQFHAEQFSEATRYLPEWAYA